MTIAPAPAVEVFVSTKKRSAVQQAIQAKELNR
jgi:hypothetical protein